MLRKLMRIIVLALRVHWWQVRGFIRAVVEDEAVNIVL